MSGIKAFFPLDTCGWQKGLGTVDDDDDAGDAKIGQPNPIKNSSNLSISENGRKKGRKEGRKEEGRDNNWCCA